MFVKITNRGIHLAMNFTLAVLAILISHLIFVFFLGWIFQKPEFPNTETITVDYEIQYGCFYTGNQTQIRLIGTYEIQLDRDHPRSYVGLPITEFSFGGYFVLPFAQGCSLKMIADSRDPTSGLYCDQMVNIPFFLTKITKISANHFRIEAQPNGHGKLPWKMY